MFFVAVCFLFFAMNILLLIYFSVCIVDSYFGKGNFNLIIDVVTLKA